MERSHEHIRPRVGPGGHGAAHYPALSPATPTRAVAGFALAVLLLAGCGRDDVRPTPRAAATVPTRDWPVVTPDDPASANAVLMRAISLVGTPYRYGGISPKTGFDCSGFVYYLYGAVFGQRIPRMPHEMVREATPVARGDLQKGDLVMFGHRGAITHVGIYSGNGQFVHATHRGSPVMVTSLDADYFNTRYLKAVRLTPQ